MPPLPPSRGGLRFAAGCEALGYHPFPTPSGILSEGYVDLTGQARAGCVNCGFCTRYGCHVDAKGSSLTTYIPVALDTGRYGIRTRCWVLDVVLDDAGRARGVRYLGPDGREHLQPAGAVFLCGYTLSNVRLLLLSTGARHPRRDRQRPRAGGTQRHLPARTDRGHGGVRGRALQHLHGLRLDRPPDVRPHRAGTRPRRARLRRRRDVLRRQRRAHPDRRRRRDPGRRGPCRRRGGGAARVGPGLQGPASPCGSTTCSRPASPTWCCSSSARRAS